MRVLALALALSLPLAAVPCVDHKDARYKGRDQRTIRESDSAKMAVRLNEIRRCEVNGLGKVCRFEAEDFSAATSALLFSGPPNLGSFLVFRVGVKSPYRAVVVGGSRCASIYPGDASELICIASVSLGLLDGRVYGDNTACEREQELLTMSSKESRP
jgi:hypothetical protein